MANLLPTVDIIGTVILVYNIQVEGKRNKFYVLYTTFTVCKFVVGFQQFYFIFFYLETATLKF